MKKIVFSVLMFAGLVSFSFALAAEVIGPTQGNSNVTVPSNQLHNNLYVSGANVTVYSQTTGDLTAAGGTVVAQGPVQQDALLAGGTVILSGPVGGDARIAGGNISVDSVVNGDVLAAGGNVTLSNQASVGGDFLGAGGNIILNARVKGYAKITGGNVTINSTVNGVVTVKANSLTFGPNARVIGKIIYNGPMAAIVESGAQVSSIEYNEVHYGMGLRHNLKGLATLAFFVQLIAWLLAGWLAMAFWSNHFYTVARAARRTPWTILGLGLLMLFAIPIIAGILFLLVVTYYIALFIIVAYVLMLLAAGITAALLLGAFITRLWTERGQVAPAWQIVVVGVVVWQLLSFVPILGWLIMLILFLMAFGGILYAGRYRFAVPE